MRDKTENLSPLEIACMKEITGETDVQKAYAKLRTDGTLIEQHRLLVEGKGKKKLKPVEGPKPPAIDQ